MIFQEQSVLLVLALSACSLAADISKFGLPADETPEVPVAVPFSGYGDTTLGEETLDDTLDRKEASEGLGSNGSYPFNLRQLIPDYDKYKMHIGKFAARPGVKYYISQIKTEYITYLGELRNNEDDPNLQAYRAMFESKASQEIEQTYRDCLNSKYTQGEPFKQAVLCCGKELWKNTKLKLATMEKSLDEAKA